MGVPFLRQQVASVPELIAWARAAQPRDTVTYHMGRLVTDRATNFVLHELAETIGLLQETSWLVCRQVAFQLAAVSGYHYLAIRTGGGWMPRAIAELRIDAALYRALSALRDRDAAMSATRSVRDHLSVSDPLALDVMTRLFALGLIEESPGRGWQLTANGARMLT